MIERCRTELDSYSINVLWCVDGTLNPAFNELYLLIKVWYKFGRNPIGASKVLAH